MLNAAAPLGSYRPELLGISDLFGSGLLPALSAGSLSSGSFRPVAAHGNNPARPPFCPHSTARRSEAVFRWSPTHFRYVDCCATVGVATQSRRLLVNSHLGANDVLIVLSANRVIIDNKNDTVSWQSSSSSASSSQPAAIGAMSCLDWVPQKSKFRSYMYE